jgi:uncharacterized protein (DUF58 family)
MRPTLRAILVFGLAFPLALLPALVHVRLWPVWLAYVGLAVLLLGLDAILGLWPSSLSVEVDVPETLFIGEDDPLTAKLVAKGFGQGATIEALVDLDPDLEPQPVRITQLASGEGKLTLRLVPRRRGKKKVNALWLRWKGPLGLARRMKRVAIDREVAVMPNVRAVRHAALRIFSERDFLAGLKVERYLGDGTEFESLKEFQPGLDHRAIDWKASAKHRKLLCDNFRAERNHQVVLALDTGHLMAEPLQGIPKLDHAINAALQLGYFSLRAGDKVGLYGFDSAVQTWTAPQGGVAAFPRIQRASADLEYTDQETNFTLGLAELGTRLRRRSLVVVLTDFVDTVTAELIIENMARLARRQKVVFVTLRDPGLDELVKARPGALADLYRSVVAEDFVREREIVIRRLRRLGIHCVDASPKEVSMQLLNRYMDIKRRELV